MAIQNSIFDAYSLKARLWPALLTGMPMALSLASTLNVVWWNAGLVSAAGSIGFTFLLAQIGRNMGHKVEQKIFNRWGGKPSVQILRHRDTHLDPHTKARYHQNIQRLDKSLVLPSAEQEAKDAPSADLLYQASTTVLINATRDTTKFALLFRENINYGFCRNMLGLKPIGIVASCIAIFTGGARLYLEYSAKAPISLFGGITFVAGVIMALVWLGLISKDWPKTAAVAYAERLLEASDALVSPKKASPKS